MTELEIENIRKVKVDPDDVIVYMIDSILPARALESIASSLRATFPDNKCAILDGGAKLQIISKEDTNAEA